jgi:hypothetical protein
LVADTDATVHEEADERHDDPEKRQKHPVLSQPGKSVSPYETKRRYKLARALPPVLLKLLVTQPVFLLALALKCLNFACLFFSVFTEVFGVTPIHLKKKIGRHNAKPLTLRDSGKDMYHQLINTLLHILLSEVCWSH